MCIEAITEMCDIHFVISEFTVIIVYRTPNGEICRKIDCLFNVLHIPLELYNYIVLSDEQNIKLLEARYQSQL